MSAPRPSDGDEKKADPASPGLVTGTLRAGRAPRVDFDSIEKIQEKLNVAINKDLELYAKLAKHYAYWFWLAKGSWGELEKTEQIRSHCEALHAQLRKEEFKGLPGHADLLKAFDKLGVNLEALYQKGPAQTYLFCDAYFTDAAKMLEELKKIAPTVNDLDQLHQPVVCTVGNDPNKSAFVQGIQKTNNDFVSQAYIPARVNSNEDQLRELVYNQIESFHADPRNVGLGKEIIFEGNYSKQFLALALDYCHLQGYPCQVSDDLKVKIRSKTFEEDKESTHRLLEGSEKNEKNEAKWQDWMNKNNKYPFSKMLDKNSVKDCESKLGLESLSPEKMAEVQVHCSEKAGSQIITDTTWKQTKPAADTALKKSAHDTKIAKDPSISIHASNTPNPEPEVKENKDRPFATIASRR